MIWRTFMKVNTISWTVVDIDGWAWEEKEWLASVRVWDGKQMTSGMWVGVEYDDGVEDEKS